MNKSLYYGDNLDVLRKYIRDETIDLCYIDPPFNSKRNYNQIYNNLGTEDTAQAQAFIDTWTWDNASEHGFEEIIENNRGLFTYQTVELIIGLEKILKKGSLLSYLISMTLRLAEIYRVLKPSGCFYLHCDPSASHYLKLILDSTFCSRQGVFQNEIIWRRTGQHNKVLRYGPIHDVIFFYTKTDKYTWNDPKRPYMQGHIDEYFTKDKKGYRTNYYGNVLTGSGIRHGESGKSWRGFDPTSKGRHWAIPGALVEDIDEDISQLSQHEKLDWFLDKGHITIKKGDAWPIYQRYLKPSDGQALSDIWDYQPYTRGTVFRSNKNIDEDVRWLSTKDSERLGYPTQKPEGLMRRIITASSNIGDTVLDAYCGCGTTIVVAQELQRNWIGIDITYQSISLMIGRLEETFGDEVINNIILDGVPQDMDSAIALANKSDDKTRKEFEKWATLTFSNNKAHINEKKGGDSGIDGIAYFKEIDDNYKEVYKKIIFSVKSNKSLNPSVIRDLNGTIEREKASLGFFITLYPMDNLVKESKKYGMYKSKLYDMEYPKIKVINAKEIINGDRMQIPAVRKSVRSAKKKTKINNQLNIED